jgi:K+-sensing histidine kinase KdpD
MVPRRPQLDLATMPDPIHVDDAQLREMLSLLSHDLRNPLAAVLTNLEFSRRLLARTQGSSDLVEAIQDSVAACELVRRMLTNLDLLTKGRQQTATLQEADLVLLAREAIQRNDKHAVQSDLGLTLAPRVASARALVDRELIALALDNLLANAIQHAPRGSEVALQIEQQGALIELSVRDRGAIVPEDRRLAALGAETRYSRGLGLLAAHAAARATGAALAIGGNEEDGSVLTLSVEALTSA